MSREPQPGPGIVVDITDPTPPYEQVRRQIVARVSSGDLTPGDRLPPVRQLANDLGLAAGTVARAYRRLENDGWVQTKRGGGTRVEASPPVPPTDTLSLIDLASEFVRKARLVGADDASIRAAVEEASS